LTPYKCSRILSRPPKGTFVSGYTRFGVQIVLIGREMRPGRVIKKAKKTKNEIKKKRKKRNSEM